MQKVNALQNWRQSDLFSEQERAVLDYTEAMTLSDSRVSDEMVAVLRNWFDDDGIVELTGLIGFQNLSSKFNSALGLPAQGFSQISLPED